MGFNVFPAGAFPLPLAIRRATPADLAGLSKMHREAAFVDYFGALEREAVEDGTYYVAEVGGWLAASGGWSLRAPAYVHAMRKRGIAKRVVEALPRIRGLFVHPDYRKTEGLARRIIQVCETEIRWRGYREIAHDASRTRKPLYEALGYKAIAPLEMQLPDGTRLDFTHMRKRVARRAPLQA